MTALLPANDVDERGEAEEPQGDVLGQSQRVRGGKHEADRTDDRPGVYLLHLEPGYRHARHYLGWTALRVSQRVAQHLAAGSRSSPLIKAALAAGSSVEISRTWPGGDRTLERRLKRQGGLSRHCPTCRERGSFHR